MKRKEREGREEKEEKGRVENKEGSDWLRA